MDIAPVPTPKKKIFIYEKKNLLITVFILILLILLLIFVYFIRIKTTNNLKQPSSAKFSETTPFGDSTNYYGRRINPDQTQDFFYLGEIIKITENQDRNYTITLKSKASRNLGKNFEIILPAVPPKTNQSLLGKNFKEMFGRGFKTVDMLIRYDQDNDFIGWEVL